MDSQNTTSFIPKTRLNPSPYRGKGIGAGVLIAIIIFVLSALLYGGAFLYKNNLQKQIDELEASLGRVKAAFEPALISEFKKVSSKIESSKILLLQHKALSHVLNLIGSLTTKDVRFSNFNGSFSGQKAVVTMFGEARSYTAVAVQAKVFENNDSIEQVSFSGLSLGSGGRVRFNVEIIFKPGIFSYKP